MTSRRLAHYLRSRKKTKKQDESTEMTISSETTYSSSAFQLHPPDDLQEVQPPQPASETLSSFQQHHHQPHSLSLLSPWKYHETVLEQAEARQVERKCRWQQTNTLLESLRDEIGSGVAETVMAERFGQKIADLHATLGAAIRPNEDGTVVVEVEECHDNDNSDDDEDLTETIIASEHEESESFSGSNGAASSSPIHIHGGTVVVESQPPVTYISVPNNNNNTRQGPVHLLYQQQTGMSDCLLVTENDNQDITTFSELKRSLELIDDFGQVERFYLNVMEQEVSVQLAWDQYCRMAESVLPAAATNETAEKSIGDVWLAELRYHQAVKTADDEYEMFRKVFTDVLQQHMTRRANVWKTLEQVVVQRPTVMFEKMEAWNPFMPVQKVPPTDVDETAVNARLRQIAEFHGTTTVILPDYDSLLFPKISNKRIIDVDSFMGRSFDTIDDEEVPSFIDHNRCDWTDVLPRSSPRQQEPAMVLDKTSKEYSNFIDKLLFSTSLLDSHFCKFTAVVGSLSGKELVPSQSSLLVVTCDSYLHIFNLGDAMSMQATPEMAIRYLSRQNQNTNHPLVIAETTLPISSFHVRLLTHLCGVKITNKSSTSRRGYKFILQNETARQMLVNLCDKKEAASQNTIRAII